MDKRAVSTLMKGCGALALAVAAALAGCDTLRSIASLHDAELKLVHTQRYLNELTLTLTLLDAGPPQPGSRARVDTALAGLERNAGDEPTLRARVRDLKDQVLAYRGAGAGGAGAEPAARIPALVAAIQAAAEQRAADRDAALSKRLHAGLAATALA